ncbi:LysE family transporter [Limisphaera ngatamarikiensis]|jgi:threonine/homoserine/homoserine lactone efflux protein|uniref:LysE family transporter n=1 Tax=Limisphaera ngatamarikiensis TaxID=1324935 RepID=A0A6M1RVG2_9BACT|nr:LysE family transporter [Limisphaera ngatamarikiensis]NGO40555.1 LysE family transporter [Limisphaera ngatamarikiensis]
MREVILSGLTGWISGLLLSIPVGPVNLTIMNEAARWGFRRGWFIGLGAACMEVIYCGLAFAGVSSFFGQPLVESFMEVFSFLFLVFLGLKFLLTRSVETAPRVSRGSRLEQRLEARLEARFHPHSAFMIGWIRTLANPGVLLFWIILAGNFMARGWVDPGWPGKLACLLGVGAATLGWFTALSWGASRGMGRLSEPALLKMERASGVVLLLLAAIHGAHIAWQLAGLRHH